MKRKPILITLAITIMFLNGCNGSSQNKEEQETSKYQLTYYKETTEPNKDKDYRNIDIGYLYRGKEYEMKCENKNGKGTVSSGGQVHKMEYGEVIISKNEKPYVSIGKKGDYTVIVVHRPTIEKEYLDSNK